MVSFRSSVSSSSSGTGSSFKLRGSLQKSSSLNDSGSLRVGVDTGGGSLTIAESISEFTRKRQRRTSSAFALSVSERGAGPVDADALECSFEILNRRCSSQGLEAGRLRFSALEPYGRTQEIKLLKDRLEEQHVNVNAIQYKHFVVISGESGTGKTTLANTVHSAVQRMKGMHMLIQGKCDLDHGHEPYSAINTACRGLCHKLMLLSKSEDTFTQQKFHEIQTQIQESLAGEKNLLLAAIPQLADIFGYPCTDTKGLHVAEKKEEEPNESTFAEARQRFSYAILCFFRIISSFFSPFVIIMDDIQWMDQASMEILHVFLFDSSIKSNFMLIGCHRLVPDDHELHQFIHKIKQQQENSCIVVSSIQLGNLTVSDVNQMIMDLLSEDESSRTLELAEICHRKTGGNAFYLVQFLTMLEADGFLRFDSTLFKWQWDTEEIETSAAATDNVVELMKARLVKLPPNNILILQIAACLRYKFDLPTIRILWKDLLEEGALAGLVDVLDQNEASAPEDIDDLVLDSMVLSGLLNCVDDGKELYTFAHDSIQETALSLLPDETVKILRAIIGQALTSRLENNSISQETASIFVAVDLLNEGPSPSEEGQQLQHAKYNLRAAKQAVQLSAFESAYIYAEAGITALPLDHWENDLDFCTSFGLCSVAAQAAAYLGYLDRCRELCEEVVRHKQLPLQDKLRIYFLLVECVFSQEGRRNAIDLGIRVLKECGCSFPKNPLSKKAQIILALRKAKAAAKKLDFEKLNLQVMNDEIRIQEMRLLDKLTTLFFFDGDPLVILSIYKQFKWTMHYGIGRQSAGAFVQLAHILSGKLFDFKSASAFAKFAMKLAEQYPAWSAKAMFVSYYMVSPQLKPIHLSIKPLTETFSIGMKSGDADTARMTTTALMNVGFQAGRPLAKLEADASVYVRQIRAANAQHQAFVNSIIWQAYLNLLGDSENSIELTGKAFNEKDCMESLSGPPNIPNTLFYFYKCLLCTFFGEHAKSAENSLARGTVGERVAYNCPWLLLDNYYRSVSLFEIAKRTGQRKYAKVGKKFRAIIKNRYKMGCPNVTHFERLVEAEYMAYRGHIMAAKNCYESGCILASRGGFIHDAAFASERYGDFLLNTLKDKDDARHMIHRAVKLYEEWGASAKVDHVRGKYKDFWNE